MIEAVAEPRGRRSWFRAALSLVLLLLPPLVAALGLGGWLVYRDIEGVIAEKFSGRRWDFPSKIYSGAYPLYPGLAIDAEALRRRLAARGYRSVDHDPAARGEYHYRGEPPSFDIFLRAFQYPSHRETGRLVRVELGGDRRIATVTDLGTGTQRYDLALEPALITGLHGDLREDRREMLLDEVPLPLVRAIIAVEDRRFFEHMGVDFKGLARALVINVKSGRIRQGGSTLTQQLVKNFFLTQERTIGRKLKEMAMALVIERKLTKRQILENYLNEIYMGQKGPVGAYGMWEAADFFFGREPRELTLGQMATLAGMIRAPNYYSPHRHPDRARARRDVVLGVLRDQGDIDEATYLHALNEPIETVSPVVPVRGASFFVEFVRRELGSAYPAEVLTREGYTIFTSLDLELQAMAERAVAEGLEKLERDHPRLRSAENARLEASLIAINPRTGAILAMVGGRKYAESQYNRAVDARRQPGSVFKPIVYLAGVGRSFAGRLHYLPTSVIVDEPFTWDYEGRSWQPANYENKHYGPVTVREALEHSLNAATARMAHNIGIETVRDLAVALGIRGDLPAYPAISLGGWEVSLLEIAKVYGVFANGGVSTEPISVTDVVDRAGNTLERNRVTIRRVVSPQDAFLITYLLRGVVERGTARRVRWLGFDRPAAGKTGTTNDYRYYHLLPLTAT
ncbi:MAG: transglycosylase domain-containing protein, partial [Candidatus Binatia bacterium]